MSRKDEQRAQDIKDAISRVKQYSHYLDKDQVMGNIAIDAIKYHLVVIGEVVANISDEFKQKYPTIPWHQIKGLRNMLTHEYFRIDPSLIKEIVTGDPLKDLDAVIGQHLYGHEKNQDSHDIEF